MLRVQVYMFLLLNHILSSKTNVHPCFTGFLFFAMRCLTLSLFWKHLWKSLPTCWVSTTSQLPALDRGVKRRPAQVNIKHGDLIVLGSDGLFDNLSDEARKHDYDLPYCKGAMLLISWYRKFEGSPKNIAIHCMIWALRFFGWTMIRAFSVVMLERFLTKPVVPLRWKQEEDRGRALTEKIQNEQVHECVAYCKSLTL